MEANAVMWSRDSLKCGSLAFEVLDQACHVMEVRLQFDFFVAQVVELLAQVGDVGLEHDINVGAGGGLLLQKFPLGLKHFVLLLQEAYLRTGEGIISRVRGKSNSSFFSSRFFFFFAWMHISTERHNLWRG